MAHSNRHAGRTAPFGALLPSVSGNRHADKIDDQVSPERQANGYETPRESTGAPVPSEWARVFRLAIKHLDRCMSLEPKVLQGDDPKAIHDLRVATRRLQQVLGLICPKPHPGEIRKLFRGLKRCRRSLSEVRNYDVLMERVEGALARKRTARREAWEAIREYLEKSRSIRLEKSLRKLAKANLSAIYVHMKEWLPAEGNSIPASENSGDSGVGQGLTIEDFYTRIAEALENVWKALEGEITQSRQEPDSLALHRTRIAAKRVRYLVEVIHEFDVSGSKEVLIWLRSLQTQLGNWHDLVVFEETVIGMIADPAFLRDHLGMALQIERLIIRNRAQKARLEEKYSEMTRDKTGFLKTRGWVQRVVDSPAALFGGSV